MPRRKQLKISAAELKIYESLIAELQKTSQFMNCDFSTLDKWCEAGFISSETASNRRGDFEPFEPGIVLSQLLILKNTH
jgi:hypothetical protein